MGAMTFIFNKIAGVFRKFGASMPSIDLHSSLLNNALGVLQPYWELANSFLPIKEILIVLGMLIVFGIAMFSFWLIQRLINLLRGAG